MARSKTTMWVAGTAVLCCLILLASWFLLISPKRAEAADLRQQAVDNDGQNEALAARIDQLKQQFAELPQRQAELAEIKQAMPEDAALPTLIRDVDALADKAGVTLMSLAPGQPAAAPSTAPTAAASPSGDAANGGDGAAGDAAATPTPGAGTVLVTIPTNLVVVGDFFKSTLFLKQLQTEMKRSFLVQNLAVQAEQASEGDAAKPATSNGDVTMTISGSVFVLRSAADAAPVAVAGTPVAPSPAQTPAPSDPTVTNN
jgi:type IV pilus assembly protein PilO